MSGANAIGTPGEQAPDGAQVLAGHDETGALAVPMVTTGVTAMPNRTQFWPRLAKVKSETQPAEFWIYVNPTTLTGGAWTAIGGDSAAEINTTATAFTGGTPVGYGTAPSGDSGTYDLASVFSPLARRFGLRSDGTQDTLLITAARQTNGAASAMRGTVGWGEIR